MGYKDKDKQREYARIWMAKRRQDWIDSQGGKCVQCGSVDRLEVDHIDPSLKVWTPSNIWSRKQEDRDRELAKCQILCDKCHSIKNSEQWHDTNNIPVGEDHHSSILTEEQVITIKAMLQFGKKTHKEIADIFNVERSTITYINLGRTWKHLYIIGPLTQSG
jgi:hypothetical protein